MRVSAYKTFKSYPAEVFGRLVRDTSFSRWESRRRKSPEEEGKEEEEEEEEEEKEGDADEEETKNYGTVGLKLSFFFSQMKQPRFDARQ
jgi:hypothetical protein